MGLFGKKEPCAICGGKVKGLFPSRIENQLICSDCYGHVHLPDGILKNMTLDEFRSYMDFREENDLLRKKFQITDQVDFGFLDDTFVFDLRHGLWTMDKSLINTIFEAKHIRSFMIYEDSTPLFEGSAAGLIRHKSSVQDTINAMMPQLMQLQMQIQMQEQMQRNAERMRNQMEGMPDQNNHFHDYNHNYNYDYNHDYAHDYHHHNFNQINVQEPFRKFRVEIRLAHPYWRIVEADKNGPTFSNQYPDAQEYLRSYDKDVRLMQKLAELLQALAFPDAPEKTQTASPKKVHSVPIVPQGGSADAISEIQRYKALLDQGILTEEEFAAKKRQLLGI